MPKCYQQCPHMPPTVRSVQTGDLADDVALARRDCYAWLASCAFGLLLLMIVGRRLVGLSACASLERGEAGLWSVMMSQALTT